MSLSSFVKVGAVVGSAAGLTASAFLAGGASRSEKQDNYGCTHLYLAAAGSLISGPFIGSGIGAGLYGAKRSVQYLRGASRPTQIASGIIITTIISSVAAYRLGNGSNR